MYRNKRNTEPREINAYYKSTCAETGKVINVGDPCVYYPKDKKVYHPDSKTAVGFREHRFDEEVLGYSY